MEYVEWRKGYTSSHVDADPKTFEILNDDYGRDKKHAFYEGEIIKGADGGSFHYVLSFI